MSGLMTDRELLVLAAKAAGLPVDMDAEGGAALRGACTGAGAALDDLPADLRAREFPSVEVAHG